MNNPIHAVLLGTAVGDSLGLPAENLPPWRIQKRWPGPWTQRFVFGRGMISEDTEHTVFVAQCLAESLDAPSFQRKLAWKLRWWLLCIPAGIGFATLRAIFKLWMGFPPSRSGVFSAGNPSECLFLLTEGMKADVPPARWCKVGQAVYYRNLFLHQLLSNNPLRIAHLSTLIYRPDNTGQLYKCEGRYYIRLTSSDSKAWSHSLSLDYNGPLPAALTPEIDAYLTVWRPLLADATTCDYVFRPNPQNEKGTANAPMHDNSLSVVLRKISRRYVPEFTQGLSGHDYRHILATTLVKNVVDGIEMASLLLHVSRQMIDNHYSHFRDSKVVGSIQELIADNREAWNKRKAA